MKEKVIQFKKPVQIILLGILGGVVLSIIIFGIGLYKFEWDNPWTNQVIKVVPYPVAIVNLKFLKYSQYRDQTQTLDFFYKQSALNSPNFKIPKRSEIRKTVLERMIRNEILNEIAKKKGLSISPLEVEQELLKIINEAGSKEMVESTLKNLYNWNTSDFKEKVLKPYLLKKKLEEVKPSQFKDVDSYLEEEMKKARIFRLVK